MCIDTRIFVCMQKIACLLRVCRMLISALHCKLKSIWIFQYYRISISSQKKQCYYSFKTFLCSLKVEFSLVKKEERKIEPACSIFYTYIDSGTCSFFRSNKQALLPISELCSEIGMKQGYFYISMTVFQWNQDIFILISVISTAAGVLGQW